jgi:hypothetical protein
MKFASVLGPFIGLYDGFLKEASTPLWWLRDFLVHLLRSNNVLYLRYCVMI